MRAKPSTQVFTVNMSGNAVDVTSVVLDKDDFDEILTELVDHKLSNMTDEEWLEAIESLRVNQCIPGVGRGNKTQWLFDKLNVKTDTMSIIVHDTTNKILAQIAANN